MLTSEIKHEDQLHDGYNESQSQPWLAMEVHSDGAPFSVAR